MANNNSRSESYEKAGVDITAGYRAVELICDPIWKNPKERIDIHGFSENNSEFPAGHRICDCR